MLTVVNKTKDHKVVKHHGGKVRVTYQVHDVHNPLNPLLRVFGTKWQADEFIGHTPKAPIKETKRKKDYSQYTGGSKKR